MTEQDKLLAEAIAEINPEAILRRHEYRRFRAWFQNWKERAEAVLSPSAGPFHTERVVTEDDSESDVGCSPCEEAARRAEAQRREAAGNHAGHADA